METVNENSRADYTVAFTDPSGVAAIPTSITYSTYCKTTGTAIKTDTAVASPAASITITLDSLDNAIQSTANAYETKVLTIKASYGSTDKCNAEVEYRVKNLQRV